MFFFINSKCDQSVNPLCQFCKIIYIQMKIYFSVNNLTFRRNVVIYSFIRESDIWIGADSQGDFFNRFFGLILEKNRIYDLGLIYELTINKAREVSILMTFTAPNCPMADQVLQEVQEGVSAVPGVQKCTIELTFEPAWDRSMLSDEARVELGLDYEEDDYGKLDGES